MNLEPEFPPAAPAKRTRLRTGISQAFWCNPKENYRFEFAKLQAVPRGGADTGTCWFDELFEGGIILPGFDNNEPRALTILLSGPPGTGKSTLATEFCYRAAFSSSAMRSHYVAVEAHKPWLVDNVTSFGWPEVGKAFGQPGAADSPIQVVPATGVPDLKNWNAQKSHRAHALISTVARFLGYTGLDAGDGAAPPEPLRDILVIDSLNTIRGDKEELFDRLTALVTSGHKIIILIHDSSGHGAANPNAEVWDFAADIAIRLDRDYSSGYLIRTLEVVKARYQPHVWGKHQLKIYEQYKRTTGTSEEDDKVKYLRAHPYREEGGIFIFPSIHYVLSRYKTKSPPKMPELVPCALPELTEFLDGGFPRGRCVGLVGGRGTHKSHLGYLHVLSRLLGPPKDAPGGSKPAAMESGLIVSLRDDEGTVRGTLVSILGDHWGLPATTIDDLEASGRLEITYYPPGFITPEEFFHRLLLSIKRLKAGSDTQVTVLFNSLDQLSSRFPLCAEQKIFIPGVIQMLSAEAITSIFVAAEDREMDSEFYGLLSMAELILTLNRATILGSECSKWVAEWLAPDKTPDEVERALPATLQTVKVHVNRFAGGQPAGSTGILELVKPGHPFLDLSSRSGLVFIPYMKRKADKAAAASATAR